MAPSEVPLGCALRGLGRPLAFSGTRRGIDCVGDLTRIASGNSCSNTCSKAAPPSKYTWLATALRFKPWSSCMRYSTLPTRASAAGMFSAVCSTNPAGTMVTLTPLLPVLSPSTLAYFQLHLLLPHLEMFGPVLELSTSSWCGGRRGGARFHCVGRILFGVRFRGSEAWALHLPSTKCTARTPRAKSFHRWRPMSCVASQTSRTPFCP